MPPRATHDSLSAEDLAELAEALEQGKRPTVYFREGTPSLNLPAGSSARVLSVEGATLMLKPRGVDDELPFEADEVRRTKRPPAAAAKSRKSRGREPAANPASQTAAQPVQPAARRPETPTAAAPRAEAPKAEVPKNEVPKTEAPKREVRKAPAKRTGAKKPAGVTITLYGSDDGWSVAVKTGGTRPPKTAGRAQTVEPEAVRRAIRELGDEASARAVDALVDAARQQAQREVDELSRRLDEAQAALRALGGSGGDFAE